MMTSSTIEETAPRGTVAPSPAVYHRVEYLDDQPYAGATRLLSKHYLLEDAHRIASIQGTPIVRNTAKKITPKIAPKRQ